MELGKISLLLFLLVGGSLFFAFNAPTKKMEANIAWGAIQPKSGCSIPPNMLCSNSTGSAEINGGEETFNSQMYFDENDNFVIEFYELMTDEIMKANHFEKGVLKLDEDSRLIHPSIIKGLGLDTPELVIKAGDYPVRKESGKYIVSFGKLDYDGLAGVNN